MNSAVPVGPSLWLTYLAAFGVAVMTFMNGGDVMWSAIRGISALLVFSTLLWFAASVWRIPPKEEEAAPVEEESAVGSEDAGEGNEDPNYDEFLPAND